MSRFLLRLALLSATVFPVSAFADSSSPLQIIVSKDLQSLVVYDGDQPIASSKVSTGKPGHTTPNGIFSILEKRKFHRSNLYSNAPMPWMQRLTWSGIALHESASVPDYPASHGCVRLPAAFAKQLFGMTSRGFHVIISDAEVTPRKIDHDNLFVPEWSVESEPLLSDATMRPAIENLENQPIEVAVNEVLPKFGAAAKLVLEKERPAAKILITRRTEQASIKDAQMILTAGGFYTGDITGIVGKKTIAAITAFQTQHKLEVDGKFTAKFVNDLYRITGHGMPPNAQLLVRRNFKPVFEAPVTIKDPQKPLGTHFFEATDVNLSAHTAEWIALTLANDITPKVAERLGITEDQFSSAEDALSRIIIPEDTRKRVETILGEGSSLTITDHSYGNDTGDGTDFITVTRKPADPV